MVHKEYVHLCVCACIIIQALIENKAKFVVCKASCGHKRAIQEMLATPEIASQLTETKVKSLALSAEVHLR